MHDSSTNAIQTFNDRDRHRVSPKKYNQSDFWQVHTDFKNSATDLIPQETPCVCNTDVHLALTTLLQYRV